MAVPEMHVAWHEQLLVKTFMKESAVLQDTAFWGLDFYMGEKPVHFPRVQVRVAYDQHAIGVHFHVRDRYIRAVARQHQDEVYKDSCVEFFFTPGSDPDAGYFNLEMNCGGIMLFHFQPEPRKNRIIVPVDVCQSIPVVHTLPEIVDPEITESLIWEVAYAIPFELLETYCPVVKPVPGEVWRGNFYKCGDATSHPHWLTWAPVAYPVPNFHCPGSFGTLRFL
ncbi:carbohydrate-binding family 9-like protein [uncultured Desulfobacter sp.]|uniref:carbohydrate-binding family 9-like protein n=1 Tax=uncultured Desulfobacter sp. TaxID=240139 RepID=UPI002AAAD122|nr:carbohydrate-binding family 9-like protein [uncultured Desulfobacter sp.]